MAPSASKARGGSGKPGPKSSDAQRARMQTAVKAMIDLERKGHPLSVREIAEYYNVPKSSLHRAYKSAQASGRSQAAGRTRTDKHSIAYLLTNEG